MASSIWRRLAKAAVRLYPAPWRARYGDEVEALLENTSPGPSVVVDLGLGALRERSRALGLLVWFVAVVLRALAITMMAFGVVSVLFVVTAGAVLSVSGRLDWSVWASRRIFDVPYVVTAGMVLYLAYSLLFSLPVLLLLLWPPIRRQHPLVARVIFAAAFSYFSFWLGGLYQQTAMLMCGWLIAVKVFPTTTPAALGGAAPTNMLRSRARRRQAGEGVDEPVRQQLTTVTS